MLNLGKTTTVTMVIFLLGACTGWPTVHTALSPGRRPTGAVHHGVWVATQCLNERPAGAYAFVDAAPEGPGAAIVISGDWGTDPLEASTASAYDALDATWSARWRFEDARLFTNPQEQYVRDQAHSDLVVMGGHPQPEQTERFAGNDSEVLEMRLEGPDAALIVWGRPIGRLPTRHWRVCRFRRLGDLRPVQAVDSLWTANRGALWLYTRRGPSSLSTLVAGFIEIPSDGSPAVISYRDWGGQRASFTSPPHLAWGMRVGDYVMVDAHLSYHDG